MLQTAVRLRLAKVAWKREQAKQKATQAKRRVWRGMSQQQQTKTACSSTMEGAGDRDESRTEDEEVDIAARLGGAPERDDLAPRSLVAWTKPG
jgi:uncharacterized protein with von Willebrand factor type A (vWA) domain